MRAALVFAVVVSIAAAFPADCARYCPNEHELCRTPCAAAPGARCRINHCSCTEEWTLPNGLAWNESCIIIDCMRICPNERELCQGKCDAAPGAVCRVNHCSCSEVWTVPSDNTPVPQCAIIDCMMLCPHEEDLCAPSHTCPDAPLATCVPNHCSCKDRWIQPTGRPAVCHRVDCMRICPDEETLCRHTCPRAPAASECAYPPRGGNSVTPLIDGHEAFGRVHERVLGATRSVWVAVSFAHMSWNIVPGTPWLDLLASRARSGIDVRLLFWRPAPGASALFHNSFRGTAEDVEWLRSRGYEGLKMRWDASPDPRHCHHEKTWLVDGGCGAAECVLTGGMVPGDAWCTDQLHARGGMHDVYAELRGPAATDVCHSFVQRWNSVADEALMFPSPAVAGPLPWPSVCAPAADGHAND
eukprot:m51a1_g14065 hypothetical protein (414) ;mRNA; f:1229804-1231908